MNIELFRDYCLNKPGVTEAFPFGEDTLVFKVIEKIFVLTDINNFRSVNLKCDPLRAVELREQYMSIVPGYHMNKKHWNTVYIDGSLSDSFIFELIDHSYEMVVLKMPKLLRETLNKKQ